MITRIVVAKFHDRYSTPAGREEALKHTREVFSTLPGLVDFQVGLPADAHCARGWDMCIVVRFKDLAAVEAYGIDPVHRAYVDQWLTPRAAAKKAWNFEV